MDEEAKKYKRFSLKDFLDSLSKYQDKPLTDELIAVSMHFCYCNALDLYDDAKLLRENGRYARAFALCVIALEELAKIPLLLNGVLLPKGDVAVWKKFWRQIRSHPIKQGVWTIYGKKTFAGTDREKLYRKSYSKQLPLDRLKQLSLYVDWMNGYPIRPKKTFVEGNRNIDNIFQMAKYRVFAFHPLHSTIERSIKMVELLKSNKNELLKLLKINEDEFPEKLFQSIERIRQKP